MLGLSSLKRLSAVCTLSGFCACAPGADPRESGPYVDAPLNGAPALDANLAASLSPLARIARVLRDEYERFDGASGGGKDGLLDEEELESVSLSPSHPRAVRDAATALLDDPRQLAVLETSGPVQIIDGKFGRGALNAVLGYAPTVPAADREPWTFKLASWNVENFFDVVDDLERRDETVPGGIPSSETFAAKVARLSQVARRVAPDILALQEVETRENLDVLAEAMAPTFSPQGRVFVDSGTPEGRNLALLSRFPIIRVATHAHEALELPAFARDLAGWKRHLVEVELDVAGRRMVVLIVHQAARQNGAYGEKVAALRGAEAKITRAVADRLRAADPRRPVAIVGDFNDEPQDASVQTFLHDGAFHDALARVPADYRWTNLYRPGPGLEIGRAFDHILITPELVATMEWAYVHHGPDEEGASDHRPVSVSVTF